MADGLTIGQAAAFAGVTVKIPPGVVSVTAPLRLPATIHPTSGKTNSRKFGTLCLLSALSVVPKLA